MATQKSAILFGSTGLIGGHLLRELLDSPAYATVMAIVQRNTRIKHAKLNWLIADHRSLADIKGELVGDEYYVFCPSLLMGNRQEKRELKSVVSTVFEIINPLLVNKLSKYWAVSAPWARKALCCIASAGRQGVHTYY